MGIAHPIKPWTRSEHCLPHFFATLIWAFCPGSGQNPALEMWLKGMWCHYKYNPRLKLNSLQASSLHHVQQASLLTWELAAAPGVCLPAGFEKLRFSVFRKKCWLRLHAPNARGPGFDPSWELDPICHNWGLKCHTKDSTCWNKWRSCMPQCRPDTAK